MAACSGFCSPGEMKYAVRTIRTTIRGLTQVCLSDMRFHRPNRLLTFFRLPVWARLLLDFPPTDCNTGDVGGESSELLTCARFEVASEPAPVSPRGSPRRELTLRARAGRCGRAALKADSGTGSRGGKASRPDDFAVIGCGCREEGECRVRDLASSKERSRSTCNMKVARYTKVISRKRCWLDSP